MIAPPEDENDESSDFKIKSDNSIIINNQTSLPKLKLTLKGPNLPGVIVHFNFNIFFLFYLC